MYGFKSGHFSFTQSFSIVSPTPVQSLEGFLRDQPERYARLDYTGEMIDLQLSLCACCSDLQVYGGDLLCNTTPRKGKLQQKIHYLLPHEAGLCFHP